MRNALFFLALSGGLAGTLACGEAAQAAVYKWIDSQGNVSYHDRPPPANSGYRGEEKTLNKKGRSGDQAVDMDELMQRVPVVFYSTVNCTVCDAVRTHLEKRKIPFVEKNVESDPVFQAELKKKAGVLTVPVVSIGEKVLTGYARAWLDVELDTAGYPKAEVPKPPEKEKETGFKAPTQ